MFATGSHDRLGVYADMLNLFNASTITGIQTRVPERHDHRRPESGQRRAPGSIIAPRQINIGARWSF